MAWFTFGPDGRLFIEAVLLSLLIAALTWRRSSRLRRRLPP
jgi:hypothetical protein